MDASQHVFGWNHLCRVLLVSLYGFRGFICGRVMIYECREGTCRNSMDAPQTCLDRITCIEFFLFPCIVLVASFVAEF